MPRGGRLPRILIEVSKEGEGRRRMMRRSTEKRTDRVLLSPIVPPFSWNAIQCSGMQWNATQWSKMQWNVKRVAFHRTLRVERGEKVERHSAFQWPLSTREYVLEILKNTCDTRDFTRILASEFPILASEFPILASTLARFASINSVRAGTYSILASTHLILSSMHSILASA